MNAFAMNLRLSGASIIRLFSLFLVFLSLLLPPALTAQENNRAGIPDERVRSIWMIGPTAMVGWNRHTGQLDPGESPACGPVDIGSEWGFGGGLSVEWMPDLPGRSLLARLTYEGRPGGSFSETFPEPLSPSDPENPHGGITWLDISYALLNVEVLFKQELFVARPLRIALEAGPALQYVLRGHARQGYETDSSAGICYDGEIPELNPIRCSLKGGVQGEIGLFDNRWIMTPGIYYDYGLTNLASSESWQVNSLVFQIDFRTLIAF